jgi:chromosome partitioning protein
MIIAVANQKGGCGKTTTCLNLGAIASSEGQRTCLIDLDPQGNLTQTFIELQRSQPTVYNLLNYGAPFKEVIVKTQIPNLDLIPANASLANLERSGASDVNLPFYLRDALAICLDYDLILIDTPPTLGALTVNAMTAADSILIPIQPSFYCLQGTNDLMETFFKVKASANIDLELLAILITMYDPRTTMAKEGEAEIRKFYSKETLTAMIPRNVKLEESPAAKQSIITYAPKSKGAIEYMAAYRELMARV